MKTTPARRNLLPIATGAIVLGLLLVLLTGVWAVPLSHHGSTLIGAWGGDNVVLELTDAGGRYYESGCTEGFLAAPLIPDGAGAFSTTARVNFINPVPSAATPVPLPPGSNVVALTGHVYGSRMDLQIGNPENHHNLTYQAVYVPPTRCP